MPHKPDSNKGDKAYIPFIREIVYSSIKIIYDIIDSSL